MKRPPGYLNVIFSSLLEHVLLYISGESGLGKSTLVNSLFLTDLYPERQIPTAQGKCTSQ